MALALTPKTKTQGFKTDATTSVGQLYAVVSMFQYIKEIKRLVYSVSLYASQEAARAGAATLTIPALAPAMNGLLTVASADMQGKDTTTVCYEHLKQVLQRQFDAEGGGLVADVLETAEVAQEPAAE